MKRWLRRRKRGAQAFELSEIASLCPRYNIAPTQPVFTVVQESGQPQRQCQWMRWGLIPWWAKDPKIGNRLINARAETLREKPSFRDAIRNRRCPIVADGFYEWQRLGKHKQPYYIRLKSGQPFALAGLWEVWQPEEGEVITSCTIITTPANELMLPHSSPDASHSASRSIPSMARPSYDRSCILREPLVSL